ncbi:MAG: DUF4845 domain-containing protein [Steroidobacteraceae bacterium]
MRKAQRGVTLIGWLFLLAPLAIVGYAAVRLVPVYKNYMAVVDSLQKVAKDGTAGATPNPGAVRNSLDKYFDTNYVDHPTVQEIQITRGGDGWLAIADYDDSVPLFGNLNLVAHFHKEVSLQ